ncbi:uncharacterized protein BT62DRAFT_998158 [Guyanagaster necrorhizus]|uniref:Uncharacterized protein n=1 Tax=Guyanagaster necrorhizus TaxID=856835 RepID=A0A9P8ALJ2_9AGAR|nr:uncharacterized protein BT62DRAFT_998158 [Guyanagaster necrorhizus MCA 3950]KAG7439701.1 hypothetical protein BT62DRAFT_998158 [Guyanagaster necrorhizus MCA 3950]
MTRLTNDSISSNSHPSHRIRQRKLQKYQTTPIALKSEPKQEQVDAIIHRSSPSPSKDLGWDHPDELNYLDASTWSRDDIVKHVVTNSFSVPGRTHRSKWATITSEADGSTTVVPNVYRIPLMFVGEFMWSSLRLVLGDDKEWNEFKTGILHVSRLCKAFLDEIRRAMSEEGIGRSWRCAMFDRALIRYRMGWLLSHPRYLKEFWEMYGEEEYRKDAVKFDWKRLVLKGLKGFQLDEEQIETGMTALRWMSGLKEIRGLWIWDTSEKPLSARNAQDYLETWQRTRLWGDRPASPPIASADYQSVDTLSGKTHALASCDPEKVVVPPGLGCDPVAFPIPSPSPEFFKLLRLKFQSQERRIAVLENEVSLLRKSKGIRETVHIPEHAVTFVPTPNFPELSDPDCSTSFWRHPLEQLLDLDLDMEEEAPTAFVKHQASVTIEG